MRLLEEEYEHSLILFERARIRSSDLLDDAVRRAVELLPRAKAIDAEMNIEVLGLPLKAKSVKPPTWPNGAPGLVSFMIKSFDMSRIPDTFTGGTFPKLQYIKLHNCTFN